uniref:GBD/FH3 domain-containing protein n=1 Tax=Panagrellus redivivus TaxID=6233 RepID=A0A7E4V9J0_PANRE
MKEPIRQPLMNMQHLKRRTSNSFTCLRGDEGKKSSLFTTVVVEIVINPNCGHLPLGRVRCILERYIQTTGTAIAQLRRNAGYWQVFGCSQSPSFGHTCVIGRRSLSPPFSKQNVIRKTPLQGCLFREEGDGFTPTPIGIHTDLFRCNSVLDRLAAWFIRFWKRISCFTLPKMGSKLKCYAIDLDDGPMPASTPKVASTSTYRPSFASPSTSSSSYLSSMTPKPSFSSSKYAMPSTSTPSKTYTSSASPSTSTSYQNSMDLPSFKPKSVPTINPIQLPSWRSSPSKPTPAPIIHDIVPLDNLSSTLERKAKAAASKPWYSTSVDSPAAQTSTLPRNQPSINWGSSTSPSSSVSRSKSFRDTSTYEDDTVIEVPPRKPNRSFAKVDYPSRQSSEEFLRHKTLYSTPKFDFNNNGNDLNQASVPPKQSDFQKRFPSIYSAEPEPPLSSMNSNRHGITKSDSIRQPVEFPKPFKPSVYDESPSWDSGPKINYAAMSSTLPSQSVKTNLPKLPAFPSTSPITAKPSKLDDYDGKMNSIRPTTMNWSPSAGSACKAVDEREKRKASMKKRSDVRDYDYPEPSDNQYGHTPVIENEPSGSQDYEWIFEDGLRSSLVLRQQPALRVKAIVDKLLHMSGRDQRRALFALKQIFQDDKDLVHEFVQSDGLDCLIKLGRISDQNHQNYILRALGQLMLYVDGMNGIIAHNETIQWLYELLDSPYRLVVKTALKLLLVFVEYTEANSLLLLAAISRIERSKQRHDWHSIVRILSERGAGDDEMLIYAMTIVNKTLAGVPDQDTFFDVVDSLDAQGFETITKNLLKMNNTQLNQQLELYERELKREDAALDSDSSGGDANLVKMRVNGSISTLPRPSELNGNGTTDRRSAMRRRQAEAEEMAKFNTNLSKISQQFENVDSKPIAPMSNGISNYNNVKKVEPAPVATPEYPPAPVVAPSWRKHEEVPTSASSSEELNNENRFIEHNNNNNASPNTIKKELGPIPAKIKLYDEPAPVQNGNEEKSESEEESGPRAPPPVMPNIFSPTESKEMTFEEPPPPPVKEPEPEPVKPAPKKDDSDDEGPANNVFAAALKKKALKVGSSNARKFEPKLSEADQQWREAASRIKEKPMIFDKLDFSENAKFEQDPLILVRAAQHQAEKNNPRGGMAGFGGGIPPPPPPGMGVPPPPPLFGGMNKNRESSVAPVSGVKLHWKPAQAEAPSIPLLQSKGTFWKKVENAPIIDTSKLARLFEQKTKEVAIKKPTSEAKPTVLQVLPLKRSQAINIGLTKLPPITVIPAAIKKFDKEVLNKDGIEKILSTMLPHDEEIVKIHDAMANNPDMTLGQAEQFLLNLSEIDCLSERLKLWLYMLDYGMAETDIAESLMDLNNAMKEVEGSETFKVAMGMLLSIGNALNGTDIKAFQLDYVSKAGEVKDPVHKYSLTHHLAEYMIDHYPDGTDLYSEFGAVSRSAKIDFDAVLENLRKLESDCKSCFTCIGRISQKDNNINMKNKVNKFLSDVAERVHGLKHVYNTTMNRWKTFLLYFGYAPEEINHQKPMNVFKMVNEFALEYRTNRDKILAMRKRMAEKRERNKTRGMMIGVAQKQAANNEGVNGLRKVEPNSMSMHERHAAMSQMLSSTNMGDDTLGRRIRGQPTPERQLIAAQTEALRKSPADGGIDAEDELLDGVVRTVTASTDSRPHDRRRARQFNRKSLRRTRTIRSDQLDGITNITSY